MTVVQPQYHMMDRYIEHEIMDVCEKYGMGITPFSPLAQGLLTGKYKKGQPYPEGSRATHQADKQINNLLTDETEFRPAGQRTATFTPVGKRELNTFCIEAHAEGIPCWDKDLNRYVYSTYIPAYHPFLLLSLIHI